MYFCLQSHLVCTIPPYKVEDIKEPVIVKLSVVSSGRSSEPHTFVYTPLGTPPLQGKKNAVPFISLSSKATF